MNNRNQITLLMCFGNDNLILLIFIIKHHQIQCRISYKNNYNLVMQDLTEAHH